MIDNDNYGSYLRCSSNKDILHRWGLPVGPSLGADHFWTVCHRGTHKGGPGDPPGTMERGEGSHQLLKNGCFFPTCQVRVVRFYQSCRLLLPPPPPPPSPRLLLPPDLNYSHPRQVLAAGPQPRPSQPSVGCRTPTTASPAQCWLPDLNHGHPRRSVGCRTSTTMSNIMPEIICQIEC